ncbi:hypothetical protein [Micrococcus terreus]|uniref:hypothetical protein n=1 Tax=Micrococcus terreus TaxID=574650 RepID=UPI003AFAA2DA
MTGQPYLLRILGFGLRAPKNRVPGLDVAGVVVCVGSAGVDRGRQDQSGTASPRHRRVRWSRELRGAAGPSLRVRGHRRVQHLQARLRAVAGG